jgi:ABC-2 type transport system permease protein
MSGKITLPPPLTDLPPEHSFFQDFMLLLKNKWRIYISTLRHQRKRSLIGMALGLIIFLSFFISLGSVAYGTLKVLPLQTAQSFLSILFMIGLASQIFFGITAAFAELYMADDLELLFMTPVSLKVVFAVKSISVFISNLLIAALFVFMPGIFCGLFYQAGVSYYVLVLLSGCGLWLMGTSLAELINLLVMRIVPPHRSKEAVGLIGAVAGIIIALTFQIPNLLISSQGNLDLGTWLAGKEQLLGIMNYFPWGWASLALIKGMSGSFFAGLLWSLLIIAFSIFLLLMALSLLERGFRQGYISLGQGNGVRPRKKKANQMNLAINKIDDKTSVSLSFLRDEKHVPKSSSWLGMWAVAKKDLLSLKRDSRESFAYIMPLILMAFFIGQFFFFSNRANFISLINILIMYTVMFSGNLALQSFGREGESDWLLNSVPLAGWPIVWGKLLAAVLPTLILMEVLLVGTSLALNVSKGLIIMLALAAMLLSLGSSAIGLYYSINNCRYNPDKPQMRISPSASLLMYLINFLFILVMGISLCYLFPPQELVLVVSTFSAPSLEGNFFSILLYGIYLLSRPVLWSEIFRIPLGIVLTGGVWSFMFFGFMSATVRQSRKGFRVEVVANNKRSKKR